MAVLVTAEVPNQTKQGYDRMIDVLGPLIKNAKGFIAHGSGETADGWRSFEIWETQEEATEFFAKYIHPNLPPGIKPRRSYQELYSFIQK